MFFCRIALQVNRTTRPCGQQLMSSPQLSVARVPLKRQELVLLHYFKRRHRMVHTTALCGHPFPADRVKSHADHDVEKIAVPPRKLPVFRQRVPPKTVRPSHVRVSPALISGPYVPRSLRKNRCNGKDVRRATQTRYARTTVSASSTDTPENRTRHAKLQNPTAATRSPHSWLAPF